MTTDFEDSICWRAASPCPQSHTSSERKLSCQAWYHCEKAGDYIIRWKCETLETDQGHLNTTALSLCRNQSDALQSAECPPPVVCPDNLYPINSLLKSSPIPTEIAIIIPLAAFAVLSVLLIVVSCYKYWSMRKRYKAQKRNNIRHHPRHYLFRDFRSPMSYHNLWGSGYQHYHYHGNKNSQLLKPHGNSYPDVYFSRPQESWKYFEHLLTSSDDSIGNNAVHQGRHPHAYSNSNRFKVDPTIATESFVYHQPGRSEDLAELSAESEGWFYQNKRMNNDKQDCDNSMECYHIYKGNLGRFQAHEQILNNRSGVNSRNEYPHLIKSSSDFVRAQQVSSIPIPGFSLSDLQETNTRSHNMDQDLQLREKHHRERFITRRRYDSDSSYESMSRYTHGFITKSHSSQQQNIISSESHHNNRHHQILTPNRVKVQTAATTHTKRTSPDVINSHNFTNRFVRVAKNIYKPVHTKSPSGSSITMSSISNNYADVSYRSFLHEHLKELAKRGAASSSTLEAGRRNDENESELGEESNRY